MTKALKKLLEKVEAGEYWHPEWPEDGDNHFRFDGGWTWASDGQPMPYIRMSRWTVLKRTPCGVRVVDGYASQFAIEQGWAKTHMVYTGARRKWAYPTKAEAWKSFLIRQNHRLRYARNTLDGVEALIKMIEEQDDGKSQ